MSEIVRSRHFGRVAVVELHRPEVRHAMNTDLLQALIGVLRGAAKASDTDAVVVTGSDRCFSSGADVSEDIDRAAALERMDLFGTLYELVATYPLPTVAA
ncbi:MAG: enoyl-CoA hydratase, partial [Actinomycetota bacterium]|nr:enoyl-CoA hydratase [Actinomycetota bacterium]